MFPKEFNAQQTTDELVVNHTHIGINSSNLGTQVLLALVECHQQMWPHIELHVLTCRWLQREYDATF